MDLLKRTIKLYEGIIERDNKDDRVKLVLKALLEMQERQNNIPLTLEEIKQMCKGEPHKIYEPIWIKSLKYKGVFCQISNDLIKEDWRFKPIKECIIDDNRRELLINDYGITWLAYRHRPIE